MAEINPPALDRDRDGFLAGDEELADLLGQGQQLIHARYRP
jgi:hypothetical protein